AAAARQEAEEQARKQANAAHAAHDLRARAEAMARTAAAAAKSAHVLRGEAEDAAQQQALFAQQSAEAAQVALKKVEEQAEVARAAHEAAEQAYAARAEALADLQHATARVMEAFNARLEAEEAAIVAQAAREAAEQAAKTQADAARTAQREREEAEQRTAAMQAQVDEALELRRQAEEAVAEANRLRAVAEEAAEQRAIDRQAVESSIRHNTELVETALRERLEAERRAAELAQELVTLRSAVVTALKDRGSKRSVTALQLAVETGRADQALAAAPAVRPVVESELVAPEVPDDVRPPGLSDTGTLWIRAELERMEALRDAEDSSPAAQAPDIANAPTGVSPSDPSGARDGQAQNGAASTQAEVAVRSFALAGQDHDAAEVTVNADGLLDVRKGATRYQFDLYDRATDLRVIGRPGQRRWRVELSRPGTTTVVLDAKTVDAEAFTRELLRWRPEVASR
ncbi:MAG TPA: hypothetical protein VGE38_07350, partial [Nocardioides sp.]|uniref:hypothetical protein n=1 Tax=Nocardioides sp. TaxID=35761 RepID=UPI002F20D0F5